VGPWFLAGRWFTYNAAALRHDPALRGTLCALEADFRAHVPATADWAEIRQWIATARQQATGIRAALLDDLDQALHFPY
jgi:hypothetical protein